MLSDSLAATRPPENFLEGNLTPGRQRRGKRLKEETRGKESDLADATFDPSNACVERFSEIYRVAYQV